ncbi:MAG: N-acetyl-gamma-glutamyl-phosphate reductase [Clostridiales bacterium]|nr:N-acetyl-gamma-glutamyl-phosphate reductase [Clostridiales bacterium]
MIKAGIIGATGYAGAELVRILLGHPEAEVTALGSQSFEGQPVSEVYPAYYKLCDLVCESSQAVVDKSDVVFAALPHGLSEPLAADCIGRGKAFIDLGADFRLENEEDYRRWYGKEYAHPALHEQAVYGLPELFREQIKGKKLIANPGCYPTSAALGLYPALKRGLVESDGIIIDSKSGTTGAGRGLSQTTHFPDCNEAFSPYKIAAHRHTPEIEQTLMKAAGKRLRVTFTPHLLPVNRGIVSTMYARLKLGVNEEKVREAYETFYYESPFVRILPAGKTANLKNVRYTNLCDISLHVDPRTGNLIVVSTIDNMVKGAAGQAVQNMNIIFGLDEQTGLAMVPPAF